MSNEIKTIKLALPFRMGSVNCYLIDCGTGYVLVDSGGSSSRRELVGELESAGCRAGSLRLILLTHGDFDHSGNAAYLRANFGGTIAMHAADAGMVERGDMFVNRNKPNLLIRKLLPLFTGFGKAERFTPDLLLAEGDDLGEYGLEARVISIPGHSKGSIGILLKSGVFFSGDLLIYSSEPTLNSLIDDLAAANDSLKKLGGLGIRMVYPGHGAPFPMA